ncbi:MAG: hypothetical protein SGPRY_006066, partial [Prymnesium sp.]
ERGGVGSSGWSVARTAESYPRDSRGAKPASRIERASEVPRYATIPHMPTLPPLTKDMLPVHRNQPSLTLE